MDELDEGAGTVWAGDMEGKPGSGPATHGIRDRADARIACTALARHHEQVREVVRQVGTTLGHLDATLPDFPLLLAHHAVADRHDLGVPSTELEVFLMTATQSHRPIFVRGGPRATTLSGKSQAYCR